MINIAGICVTFTGRDLFKDISFVINPKDRIGLVGKNGVGKSTLLKIIAGKQQPTKGGIVFAGGESVGYLPQEIHHNSEKSIFDEAMTAFDEINQLEEEIERLGEELGQREDYESDDYANMLNRLTECHDRIHHLGGTKMESEVEKILKGLGFSEKDLSRPMTEFSGGWQMRVELAKLLLIKPDLLLLDEPTNHLDIESILWLEDVFINYPGAIMMVSHDRMFLDNITNRTIEIVFGKIYDYKANYTQYFELREERLEQQQNAYKNQQRYIAHQERFIERFKAKATKAAQAQSAQKRLDKIERIEFDELDTSTIKFHFPPAPRSGDVVVRANHMVKAYGEKTILNNLTFDILRGERVAFVGKNGEGKSTLVKIITGNETVSGGELKLGHNVDVGYYAQIQEKTLDENKTVLATIEDEASNEWANIAKIRGLLGAFLFDEDDVDKKVKVLSGGEKSRLALARLLLNPVNLLILDEPTNHLDIASKEVLKEALIKYDGTLIVVSHDRDFLQGLTNKTFEFSNRRVREHYGDINNFLDAHKVESFRQFENDRMVALQKEAAEKQAKQLKQSNAAPEKDTKKLKSAIKKEEDTIERLEKELAAIVTLLQDPEFYKDEAKSKETVAKHDGIKQQLSAAMSQWEQLNAELEANS
ncbi:MAG: ABC-F family ATP-binding cassette domain-containing protein [Chitinophagales bacterium]|nr:ABC-F family ATP-binding cassette domain-containing protein [Chitinophagales bacterium]